MFNSTDKALVDRAIRRTSQEAVDHKASNTINGTWPSTAEGRKDKRHYDALARDAADLKALCIRMMKENGDATVAKYVNKSFVATAEVPLAEAPAPFIPPDPIYTLTTGSEEATSRPSALQAEEERDPRQDGRELVYRRPAAADWQDDLLPIVHELPKPLPGEEQSGEMLANRKTWPTADQLLAPGADVDKLLPPANSTAPRPGEEQSGEAVLSTDKL